ncbi:MAG TPA: LysM domain-containing protein [Jatrophihabitantaceae bacterium]|nr:LysM domain-containing protein [Jatrophihabitantaceae bacterium]
MRAPHAATTARGTDAAIADLCGGLIWLGGAWLAVLFVLVLCCAAPGALGGAACRGLDAVAPRLIVRVVATVAGGAVAAAPASATAVPSSGTGVAPPVVPATASLAPLVPPVLPMSPAAASGRSAVVVRSGDTLWAIARDHLARDAGPAEVSCAVARWHAANRAVLGADADLILPGQHLLPPSQPEQP